MAVCGGDAMFVQQHAFCIGNVLVKEAEKTAALGGLQLGDTIWVPAQSIKFYRGINLRKIIS
jgi:hypothetical protein